jgi:hypothetical protein
MSLVWRQKNSIEFPNFSKNSFALDPNLNLCLQNILLIRYRSKFEKSIKEKDREMKTAKQLQHRTFGFAEIQLPTPDKFLRKDEGIRRQYERPKTSYPRCTLRRPPIPHIDELKKAHSMQIFEDEKNFKVINIKRAKSAFLRNKPAPKCFEQMPPVYVHAPKYGRVPTYLMKINEQLRKMQIESKKHQEQMKGSQEKDFQVVSREEKNKLLEGLQV